MIKITLTLLTTFLLYSCGTNTFVPPCDQGTNNGYYSNYFPIDEGNKWEYEVTSFDGEERFDTHSFNLCDIDTIFYKIDGQRYPYEAYKVCLNDNPDEFFYFAKCEDGAYMIGVNDWYHKEIKSVFKISNNPGQEAPNKDFSWGEQKTISVPAGEYQVWTVESTRELSRRELAVFNKGNKKLKTNKIVKRRYYFAEGVGLVKMEEYSGPGVVAVEMKLTDFDVKSGGKGKKVR